MPVNISNLPSRVPRIYGFRDNQLDIKFLFPTGYDLSDVSAKLFYGDKYRTGLVSITVVDNLVTATLTREDFLSINLPVFEFFLYIYNTARIGATIELQNKPGTPVSQSFDVTLIDGQVINVDIIDATVSEANAQLAIQAATDAIQASEEAQAIVPALQTDISSRVPKTTTVNGKPLTNNVSIDREDISGLLPKLSTQSTFVRIDDTIYNIIDGYNGEGITFTKGTNLLGSTTPITDANVDNVLYIKQGNEYFIRNFSGFANVLWWGAKRDGVTDDTVAIQKAVNAVRRGCLYFPRGTYRITSSIIFPSASFAGVKIIGESGIGQGGTLAQGTAQIIVDGAFEGFVFNTTTDVFFHGVEIQNIHFKGLNSAGNSTALSGVTINRISNFYIHRCGFSDFYVGAGLKIDGVDAKVQYGLIKDCHFGKNLKGALLILCNGTGVIDCYFDGANNNPGSSNYDNVLPNSIGLEFQEGDTNYISGNKIQFYYKGVVADGIQRFLAYSTRIEGCPQHGFLLTNCPDFLLDGGGMTNFIIGGGTGIGIEVDSLSTNGIVIGIPITSFTTEILDNSDGAITQIRGNVIRANELRSVMRHFTSGYFQGPEIRSATANATTDARILLGSGGIRIVQNKVGGTRMLDLQNMNASDTSDFYQARNSAGTVLNHVNYLGKHAIRFSSDPTAALHIGGSSSTAPGSGAIKIEPSTLVAELEENLLEYNGTDLLFTVGAKRYKLLMYLTNTKVIDPPSIAANSYVTTTVTVTGATLGMISNVSFSIDVGNDIIINSRVSSADTVTVIFRNISASPIDLSSGILTVRVG